MATATTINKLLKNAKFGKAGLALTAAQVGSDELKAISLREYNYDFVGLVTKLVELVKRVKTTDFDLESLR